MKKKLLWLGIFFIVLMAAFYFFLFANTDYYKAKLPVLNYVRNFSFTDQNGKQISQRNVGGKVYVAEYFLLRAKAFAQR